MNKIEYILKTIRSKKSNEGFFYGYTDTEETKKIQSIFTSALISRILLESSELIKYKDYKLSLEIKKVLKSTIKLIEKEQKKHGTWNYYVKKHIHNSNIIPDDLDDTFNCLLALELYDRKNITHRTLFKVMNILLKTEQYNNSQLSYNTWIEKFEDIDPVIQVIVFKFLTRIKSVPSQFEGYLKRLITNIKYSVPASKYYENKLYILMELSSLPFAREHSVYFERYLVDIPENTFDLILYYQTKQNLGLIKDKDVSEIIKIDCFKNDGAQIYIEKNKKETEKQYCYSESVKYSLFLKLLCSINTTKSTNRKDSDAIVKNKIYLSIKREVEIKLTTFNINLSDIDKIIFKNTPPIKNIIDDTFQWIRYFNNSEVRDSDLPTVKELIKHTYYGWIGYTALDAVIDKEITDDFIAIGNYFTVVASTVLKDLICRLDKKENRIVIKFKDYVDLTYSNLHKAYYLESKRKALNKDDLSFVINNKSIGHSLSYLYIYTKYGRKNEKDLKNIYKYFLEYLKMKQLSDDMHDWKIDIKAGRMTLPLFYTKKIDKKYKEDYMNNVVMNQVLDIMRKSSESLSNAICSLNKCIKREDQIKIIDESNRYINGIKQAVMEIKLLKHLNNQ